MNDDQLRTFVTVADCGSLTRAEGILFTSRQALKKRLDALEAEAGTELFVRGARGYALTPAGDVFYDGAVRMLALREETLSRIARDGNVRLRVGSLEGGTPRLLLSIAAAYAETYPNRSIEIAGIPIPDMPRACLDGEIDLYSGSLPAGITSGLCHTDLGTVGVHCLMAKNHLLSRFECIEPADLEGQTLGVFNLNPYGKLTKTLKELGVRTNLRIIDSDAYSISNHCYSGHIVLCNRAIASEFETVFCTVPLNYDCDVHYGFVHRSTYEQPVSDFLQIAARVFRERHTGRRLARV